MSQKGGSLKTMDEEKSKIRGRSCRNSPSKPHPFRTVSPKLPREFCVLHPTGHFWYVRGWHFYPRKSRCSDFDPLGFPQDQGHQSAQDRNHRSYSTRASPDGRSTDADDDDDTDAHGRAVMLVPLVLRNIVLPYLRAGTSAAGAPGVTATVVVARRRSRRITTSATQARAEATLLAERDEIRWEPFARTSLSPIPPPQLEHAARAQRKPPNPRPDEADVAEALQKPTGTGEEKRGGRREGGACLRVTLRLVV